MKRKFFLFILGNAIVLLAFAQPHEFSIYEFGIEVNLSLIHISEPTRRS